jgi:hypothetical protein
VKKFKKAMALSLALAMGLSLVACGSDDSSDDTTTATQTEEEKDTAEDTEADNSADASDTDSDTEVDASNVGNGEKIYVYSWNDELGNRLDSTFRTKYPELSDQVEYINLNVSGTTDEYPAKIQGAVDEGSQYPSLFASDESLMLSFAAKDFTAPLAESGFDVDAYAATAYQYTVDFATVDGELMAATWQATPGIMLFNKDMAEEVLGTSDSDEVQAMVSDWDGFFEVAQKMKDAGYYMVSGADEVKYPLLANKETAWVVDGKLSIYDSVYDMLELSKKIYDEGYSQNSAQWSSEWTANMSNGTTFCFFGTTWFIGDTVFVTEDTIYHSCPGPVGYYWGGSYFLYGKDCPNPELAALVVASLTTDVDLTYSLLASGDEGCVNNTEAVAKAIADGVGAIDKLDGETPLATFDEGAKMIDMSKSTAYDSQINTILSTVSTSYNVGDDADIDAAIADLKQQVASTITDIVVE